MAEEQMDEVVVSEKTPKKQRGRPFSYSPLQAGLFGTIAAAGAGPLAPIVGLGTALVTKLRRDNYNDQQSRFYDNLDKEHAAITTLLDSESKIGTPEEQRQLQNARSMITDGYARLATDRNDPNGMALIDKGRELVTGVIGGDIEAAKKEEAEQFHVQRDMVASTAKRYQSQYQSTIEQYQNAEKAAMEIINLVNDPKFDPNKPINKAHLADLVSMGGLMFRDVPDAMDAISEGAGSLAALGKYGQAAGGIVGGITSYIKADDFKVNPSDFYKFAINLKDFAGKYTKSELEQLGRQSQALDGYAKKAKVLPGDMSVIDFVSGGEKELRTNDTPALRSPVYTSPAERQRILDTMPGAAADREARIRNNKRGVIKRPTN